MARGDARQRVGEAAQEEGSSRTYCGTRTVSGDSETGYRISLPLNAARGDGIQAGDELEVEHVPATGEFVIRPADETTPRIRTDGGD